MLLRTIKWLSKQKWPQPVINLWFCNPLPPTNMSTHAKVISIVLNGTLCHINLWVCGLCQFVLVSKGELTWTQQTAQPLGSPVWSSSSSGDTPELGGSPILLCYLSPSSASPLCFCIQIKTMASTSSVSQVSAQTWSWDNLPCSSFLAHQMRANVCLSFISFPFSHLLRTFIIQIRMLSGKMDGQKDRRCCRPCSHCASPLATMRWR